MTVKAPLFVVAKKNQERFSLALKILELSGLWKSPKTMALEEFSLTISHSTEFSLESI